MPKVTNDTDVEVYILGVIPSYIVEVYIPGDQKYTITSDRTAISNIRRQLDKEHGITKIGDVTISLKNDDNRFSRSDPSSIFFGKQVVKDWVRITAGYGPTWSNSPAVQFQGRIKSLRDTSAWTATMVVYDALQDMLDAAITNPAGWLVSEAQVPGMNPIDILEYLFDSVFGLRWFNMDTLSSGDSLFDSDSKDAAREATEGMKIGDTLWPAGSKFLDMAADLVKMIGGNLYAGKDGKVNVYVFAPSQETDSARGLFSFVGDVTVKEPEIIFNQRDINDKTVISNVSWKYGQAQTEHSSEVDTESEDLYHKTLNLTTKWELDNNDTLLLDIIASRLLARFAEPIDEYDARISWLMNGDGLAMDLTNIVDITDPALALTNESVEVQRLQTSMEQQVTQAVLYDASALKGKFWFFSSEIDEGDGLGITGGTFVTNWLRRFLFFSNADTDNKPGHDPSGNNNSFLEPTLPPIDDWDSGVESHFIFW